MKSVVFFPPQSSWISGVHSESAVLGAVALSVFLDGRTVTGPSWMVRSVKQITRALVQKCGRISHRSTNIALVQARTHHLEDCRIKLISYTPAFMYASMDTNSIAGSIQSESRECWSITILLSVHFSLSSQRNRQMYGIWYWLLPASCLMVSCFKTEDEHHPPRSMSPSSGGVYDSVWWILVVVGFLSLEQKGITQHILCLIWSCGTNFKSICKYLNHCTDSQA